MQITEDLISIVELYFAYAKSLSWKALCSHLQLVEIRVPTNTYWNI